MSIKIKEYNPNAFYTIEDIRFVSLPVYDIPVKVPTKRLFSHHP